MHATVGRPTRETITARTRDLNIASFSDVHLGHPQTPTALILANLKKAFPDTPETGELDLIFLGGDLFDAALQYSSDLIRPIELWLYQFMSMCARRNIVLRVLEGTPSHDRGQSKHLMKILSMTNLPLDFQYIETISVEHIESLGITVLYVPDFTSPDTDKIWHQVQTAMSEAGVTHVDYANIHGAFTYQMPPMVHHACHVMERYLGIVRNYIFTGHIHLSSVYDRILSNGSHDRLAHGEEEDKGHWRAKIRTSGEDDFTFKVNTGAKIYRSIDCTGLDLDAAMEALSVVQDLPLDSAVRIIAERGHPVHLSLSSVRKLYPHVLWTTKLVDIADAQKNLLVDLRETFQELTLTPENVKVLLLDRLRRKGIDDALLARCETTLNDFV